MIKTKLGRGSLAGSLGGILIFRFPGINDAELALAAAHGPGWLGALHEPARGISHSLSSSHSHSVTHTLSLSVY